MNAFEQHLIAFPPFLCFALATTRANPLTNRQRYLRHVRRQLDLTIKPVCKHRRMTRSEIAARSGINQRTVERIKSSLVWDGISVKNTLAFQRACGVEFGNVKIKAALMRKNASRNRPMPHLDARQLRDLSRMLREYQQVLERKQ